VFVRYCVRLDERTFRVQLSNVTSMPARLAYFVFERAEPLPSDDLGLPGE
jgi:hypothetical protein